MSITPLPPSFEAALNELRAITDPEDRARAAFTALDRVPDFQAALRGIRQDAFKELRETMTQDEIGSRLGMSAPRVSQILRGVSKNKPPKATG